MKHTIRSIARVAVAAAVVALVSLPGAADDKDLIEMRGAPPNVMILMDAGATMVNDPETEQQQFFTSGDDPGSKLEQAKQVLSAFIPQVMGQFNLGLTYTDLPGRAVNYLNYVYTVGHICSSLPEDPADLAGCSGTATFDGINLGENLRLGDDANYHNTGVPTYPIRYGQLGDETYCRYSTDNGATWVDAACDAIPIIQGTIKVESHLLDTTGADKGPQSAPYYYPAYSWYSVPQWIKDGLNGVRTWANIAEDTSIFSPALTISATDPVWKQQVHDRVMAEMAYHAQIGGTDPLHNGRVLRVVERKYVAQTGSDGNPRWSDPPELQYVVLNWVKPFVVYDRPDYEADASQISSSTNFTSVYWNSNGQDNGYVFDPTTNQDKTPLIPIPAPDPTTGKLVYDPVTYQNELLSALLPQPTPFFFFPPVMLSTNAPPASSSDCKDNPYYRPCTNENWVPLTGAAVAGGRKNISTAISNFKNYFSYVESREDPFAFCRNSYLILLTDGSLPNDGPTENEASSFGRPIFVVGFGPRAQFETNGTFWAIAENSGGEAFVAENAIQLAEVLKRIAVSIEERTRAFAALAVSSVQTTSEQKEYIATFYPFNLRSIWQGHLRAYLIDPLTGTAPLDANGHPDETQALWDAGVQMATTGADQRKVYFGDPWQTGANRTRYDFSRTDSSSRAKLQSWIEDATKIDVSVGRHDEFQSGEVITDASGHTATINFWSHPKNTQAGTMSVNVTNGPFATGTVITGSTSGTTATITAVSSLFDNTVDFMRGIRDAAIYDTDSVTGGIEVLGDVFHSLPQLVGTPTCVACYQHNLKNYLDFFNANARRRFVLYVGANDGNLHAFDAGIWDNTNGIFDNGTGDELFAWVPQSVMFRFNDLATTRFHQYSVDGTPTVADVYIDDDGDSNTPREWRTVLLTGMRRGGRSILCLDVTQPDTYDNGVPQPTISNGKRLASCAAGGAGCSGKWPAFRWEFEDLKSTTDALGNTTVAPADDDGDGYQDLGDTWSRPLVGFVRTLASGVTDTNQAEVHSVAIFGGGYDPNGHGGNWVYIVDVETGKAILKLPTVGMVTAQVAAVDDNIDGFPNRLYWATTAGRVYRLDVPNYLNLDGSGNVTNWPSAQLVLDVDDSNGDGTPDVDRPFYMTPTLVQIGANADGSYRYGIVIGTGNRENIMEESTDMQRFYAFTDDGPNPVPLHDGDLQDVSATVDPSNNYLQNSSTKNGWYFDLADPWEKVNTRAVVFEGKVIFSTFTPSGVIEPVTLDNGEHTCKMRGDAKTYLVNLLQGNPTNVSSDTQSADDRYIQHDSSADMATDPTIMLTASGDISVVSMLDDQTQAEASRWEGVPVNVTSWKEN